MEGVLRELAPHIERYTAIAVNARSGARALVRLFQQVARVEPQGVDVMMLNDLRRILTTHAAGHRPHHIFTVLPAAEVMTMGAEVGRESTGEIEYMTPHHQISAARDGAVLQRDGDRGASLIVTGDRQWVDAIGPRIMYPPRLGAVPVRQDASAIQPRVWPSIRRARHGNQIFAVSPVVIVNKGDEIGFNLRSGMVARMRLAG